MAAGILFFVGYRWIKKTISLSTTDIGLFHYPPAQLIKTTRVVMAIFVSAAVLGVALYVVLSATYETSTEKWAYASIGTILGFWLRPEG